MKSACRYSETGRRTLVVLLVSLLNLALVLSGCTSESTNISTPGSGPVPPGPAPGGDTFAPVISSLSIYDISSSSATVAWTTNEASSTQVQYGTTAAYGSSSGGASNTTSHSVTLSGLTANTLYHYRVVSMDSAGNTATSSDATFSTTVTVPNPGSSLTIGYNHTTRSVTAATVVLDLAMPSSGNYPVWVSGAGYPNLVRAATHSVLEGGYFGRGFSRFSPGNVNDGNRGEHYCGIGQIFGFNNVGDSSRMVVGQLVRFGTSFFTDQASPNAVNGDIKELILINDSGERPMILTKGGGTRVLGACDGTTCNTTGSVSNIDYHNDGNHLPDINNYLGQWLWVEFAFNSNVPFTRTRVWSEDGSLQGGEIIAPWASPGRVTMLDVIGFVNGIPVQGAQPYYDLERVEFRVGTDSNISPPAGFPGSAR